MAVDKNVVMCCSKIAWPEDGSGGTDNTNKPSFAFHTLPMTPDVERLFSGWIQCTAAVVDASSGQLRQCINKIPPGTDDRMCVMHHRGASSKTVFRRVLDGDCAISMEDGMAADYIAHVCKQRDPEMNDGVVGSHTVLLIVDEGFARARFGLALALTKLYMQGELLCTNKRLGPMDDCADQVDIARAATLFDLGLIVFNVESDDHVAALDIVCPLSREEEFVKCFLEPMSVLRGGRSVVAYFHVDKRFVVFSGDLRLECDHDDVLPPHATLVSWNDDPAPFDYGGQAAKRCLPVDQNLPYGYGEDNDVCTLRVWTRDETGMQGLVDTVADCWRMWMDFHSC